MACMVLFIFYDYCGVKMKIVALSDTHTKHRNISIPKGDILIFAGDFEVRDTFDLIEMRDWLNDLDFKHIVTIFGNHDFTGLIKLEALRSIFQRVHYLCNSSVVINGIKIWGSSYSPMYNDWAWMKPDNYLKEIWSMIPLNTDIVVTHCMPYGILDQVLPKMESVGSLTLRDRIKEVQPIIQIGGHLHESYGKYTDGKTDYYNVSVLDEQYQVANPVTIIEV